MNRQIVAKELLRVAKDILSMEFRSESAMHTYLKEHPNADPSNHTVVKIRPQDGEKDFEGGYNHKGQKHGKHISYHASKNNDGIQSTKSIANYEHGKLHGPAHGFHPNGKKHFDFEYTHGTQTGTQKMWDENGKLVYHKKHNMMGQPI